jgi:predicted amidohydrolase YtcJ
VAVHNGLDVALGDQAVEAIGVDTQVIGLQGAALLPGFGDGHVHPFPAGLGLLGVPIREAVAASEIQAVVADFAGTHPEEEWITGNAFDPSIAPGGLSGRDGSTPSSPVVRSLRTMDHHTLWVNSEALRRVGYDATTADPDGGEIVRRDDGTPLGTLRE